MAIVMKGEYNATPPTLATDGEYENLQLDNAGNLRIVSGAPNLESEVVVAGAASTLGKIGVLPTTGTLYVAVNASGANYSRCDWRIQHTQASNITFYRARTNVLSGTLTLTDATAVDDGDTCVINGLTFTAESTEDDADASERKYWTGASNAAAAVNLAALLSDATYGIPGLTSATAAAVDTTDVITLVSGTNTALQFAQGTSDANEIAWASTTLASLIKDEGGERTAVAANNTTAGTKYEQWVDGWPWLFCSVYQSSGSDSTVVVGATLS